MAFDMKADGLSEAIQHHEELIFEKINDDDAFPEMNRIWEAYYDGPRIYPNQANQWVHELIDLKERKIKKDEDHLIYTIDRLLAFFSKAYRKEVTIQCISD